MAYAVENALASGARESAGSPSPEPARADLDLAADAVIEELRRRLGSIFVLDELADFYAEGTDWSLDLARRRGAARRATVVDAAFAATRARPPITRWRSAAREHERP